MRLGITGIWLVICAIIAMLILWKVRKLFFKIILVALIVVVFLCGTKVINLNTISAEVQEKVQTVADMVGGTSIKTEGGSVLVKVEDTWYDVSKLSVVGDFTKDITLKYDGEIIYVGHSGITNVLKALESVGLLKSE